MQIAPTDEPPPADTTLAQLIAQTVARARQLGIPFIVAMQGVTLQYDTPATTETAIYAAIHDLVEA